MVKFILSMVVAISFLLQGCGSTDEKPVANPPMLGNLMLQTQYQSVEQLSQDSTLVAQVEVTGNYEDVDYQKSTFRVSELLVKKVEMGDPSLENQIIKVVELASVSIDHYDHSAFLLFLHPYEGPLIEKAYVNTGVYQGEFAIHKHNKLTYEPAKYEGQDHFQSKLAAKGLTTLVEKAQLAQEKASFVGDEE